MAVKLTPETAWEGYVGNQHPSDFWELSRAKGARTYREAVQRYVDELELPGDLVDLLTTYLEKNLA